MSLFSFQFELEKLAGSWLLATPPWSCDIKMPKFHWVSIREHRVNPEWTRNGVYTMYSLSVTRLEQNPTNLVELRNKKQNCTAPVMERAYQKVEYKNCTAPVMERAYQKVEYKTAQHQLWIERTRKLSTELQRLAFKYCNRIGHTYIYILGFGSNLIITYFHEIKVPQKKGAVEIKFSVC